MKKLFIFLLLLLPLLAASTQKKPYIVRFRGHNRDKALHELKEIHHSYLLSVKGDEEEARASLLYSYQYSINGFSAVLTPDEASKLSKLEEVVSIYPSDPHKYSLQTTRSWEFVGLDETKPYDPQNLEPGDDLLSTAKYGQDIIVGHVDNGVWPESESFNDEGMEPVPESWKGICDPGLFNTFHCNKKIIGGKYYLKSYEHFYGPLNFKLDDPSPRDVDGHGTHTASTVAGRQVTDATIFGGFAPGTASGGAPLARLAIYKACWADPNKANKADGDICTEDDALAAIDDAVRDGVHVITVSIGTNKPLPYHKDGIALGALNAVQNNIVVACSAGNSGPAPATVSNPAPWVITVGASSVDRDFIGPVQLGNGLIFKGKTLTSYANNNVHPLVHAADVVVPGVPSNEADQCLPGSLSPESVQGKIVLCTRGQEGGDFDKGVEVRRAGGAGLILGNDQDQGYIVNYVVHVLPATAVSYNDGVKIYEYIKSTSNPMAIIKQPIVVSDYKPAPFMASFSSRGPSVIDPYILKPDITAPGLNIMAAWSGASSPSRTNVDTRTVKYNIFSGTSMSCPHVAAAAVLLRAIHPDWSSAAIRSALMTTAWTANNMNSAITNDDGSIANPFTLGSGHFRPIKAADPGLVYGASYEDYIVHICSLGYTNNDSNEFECPNGPFSPDLNYPSMAIPNLRGTVTLTRQVTNVGGNSTYTFSVEEPMGVSVTANPSVLCFEQYGQTHSFTITVSQTNDGMKQTVGDQYVFGSYTWSDGIHDVRSPIAVSFAA